MAKRPKVTLPRPQRHCVYCTRPEAEGFNLSSRGICPDCQESRLRAQADQLRAREGAGYDEWLISIAESINDRLAERFGRGD